MSRTSSIVKDRYNKKAYDEIKIRVFKGNKEIIQNYCKDKNITVNKFINELINMRLSSEGIQLINKTEQ